MPKHNLTPSDLKRIVADTAETNRIAQARPSWGDLKGALKREAVPDASGVLTMPVSGKRELAAVGEMMRPAWRLESRRGSELSARDARVAMRDAQGRTHLVREAHEDRLGRKKGMLKVGRWGKPNLIERDGRWYRYAGREEWREVMRIEGRWVEV